MVSAGGLRPWSVSLGTGNCQCRWQVTLVTVHHNDRAAGWDTLATVSESESGASA